MKSAISLLLCLLSISFCFQLNAQSFDENDFTLILEAGNINSQVFEINSIANSSNNDASFKEKMRFLTPSDEWYNISGFSASLKFSKTINKNIFDSNVSLDFISGISYKETNLFLASYGQETLPPTFTITIIEYPTVQYPHDLKLTSLEVPLEFRSNFSYKNINFAPILGIGIDIPLSKRTKNFEQVYIDELPSKGELINEKKLEIREHFNFATISKIEISYTLPNNHKIKVAGFYNINITNQFTNQLVFHQGLSTKGIQIGYEIPLTIFVKNKASG